MVAITSHDHFYHTIILVKFLQKFDSTFAFLQYNIRKSITVSIS
ncbi:hypothetical protein CULT_1550005 [[Clostridium] ultunense Esp]|nr:hypothetical protein CULT_1550005 [[Clostridium] ultunense Esp]